MDGIIGKTAKLANEKLTQKAYLNVITAWVDKGAHLLVNFIVTPLMISYLGPIYFGVWKVLGQLNSYMATSDARAGTSLKWIISKDRSIRTDEELQKSVSAAIFTNLIFSPIYLTAGTVLVWIAPSISGINEEDFFLVRVTAAVLVSSFIVKQFFFIFESVLTGMNLAYKRMGIRAGITILSGGLTVFVLYAGYGLIGLASVQVAIGLFTGLTFWWIVKKVVPWFGFARVNLKEILSFTKLTGWFLSMKIADLLNQSIDMILLGYLAGPKWVAIYAISRFSIQSFETFLSSIIGAVAPGLGKFVGEQNFKKVIDVREQVMRLNWIFLALAGVLVIVINESFIHVWAKENLYAGSLETFMIVLVSILRILYKIDGSIIAMTLDVRKKIFVSMLAASLTIASSFVLIPVYSILGLLISLLFGAATMNIGFSILVSMIVDVKVFKTAYLTRTSIFSVLLMVLAVIISPYIFVTNWLSLIIISFVCLAITIPLILLIGMKRQDRLIFVEIKKKLRFFGKA